MRPNFQIFQFNLAEGLTQPIINGLVYNIDYLQEMNKNENTTDEQVWYIYVNEETRGPLGLRDLDVLLRTNQINSRTYCWKNGLKQWKPMIQIQQIKLSILDSSNEILNIEKKAAQQQQTTNASKTPGENQLHNADQQQDHMIENQDQNPLTILEVTVENLLKKTFHQNQEGKWNIYNQEKGQWHLQDEEPTQKMQQMKNFLLNKLKNEFFADEKNRRKYKHPAHTQVEPQIPLTKQQLEKRERNKKKTKRAAQKKKQKWYQARINTFVYISGLPFDITQQELKQFASKAGVLRIDLSTGKEKLKLYKDQNGLPKGDAAVSYARQQSVEIALQVLNGSEIRDGFKIKVEKAHFNQKDDEYKRRETKKQAKVKKILAKKIEEKQLGWQDDLEDKGQGFRIVIMKNIFTLEQANNADEIEEIKSDITSEINTIGTVKRIRFFENHPDGIVELKFEKDVDAQKCVQVMNGRFFDGKEIICEYWDGETDYKLDAKSLALQQERLMMYGSQLQGEKRDELGVIEEKQENDGVSE